MLIVGDISFVRYALRSFLRANTTVKNRREAADGLEADEIAKQQKLALILMDPFHAAHEWYRRCRRN